MNYGEFDFTPYKLDNNKGINKNIQIYIPPVPLTCRFL